MKNQQKRRRYFRLPSPYLKGFVFAFGNCTLKRYAFSACVKFLMDLIAASASAWDCTWVLAGRETVRWGTRNGFGNHGRIRRRAMAAWIVHSARQSRRALDPVRGLRRRLAACTADGIPRQKAGWGRYA